MNEAGLRATRPDVVRFILKFAGKRETVVLLSALILTTVFDMLGIAIIFPYIQVVTNPNFLSEKTPRLLSLFGTTPVKHLVWIISLALIAMYLCKGFLQGALIRYQQRRLATFTARLTDDTVSLILAARYGLFQQIAGSELAGAAYSNTVHATIAFRALIQIGNELCFLAFLGLAFLIFRPLLTLTIILSLGVVAALIYAAVIRPTTMLGKQQSSVENERYRLLFSIVNAIRDIKVMGLAHLFDAKNREVSTHYATIAWRYNFNSALPLLIVEVVVLIAFILSTLLVMSTGATSQDLLPILGVVAVASVRAIPAFAKLMAALNAYRFSRSFVERLIVLRNQLSSARHLRSDDGLLFERRIELRKVSFAYPDKPILHDIDLDIERGQSIGIVGISGSGKTTLLDLITGLQPASSGQFVCDDKPFNPYQSASLEKMVGYVPQVLTLLDETMAFNISFEHKPDAGRLMRAVKIANLETLVQSLPDGLNTRVGENGMNLSGGQRQRIGIARALYRQPTLLIFDEATSALDAQTEKEVSNEIGQLRGELTTVMVSHRLQAVMDCDQIYVITHGRVQNRGTHSELLAKCELYRDLYALQVSLA
jgi:ATP-binding cassette, subfamily B, bacterial PglK